MSKNKIRYIHYFVSVLITLSPILIDWQISIVINSLVYLQVFVLGKCILTIIEHGRDSEAYFLDEEYAKLGIRFSKTQRKILVILQYTGLIVATLIIQVVLGIAPLVHLIN